jgi:bud emergence protein 1
MPPTIPIAKAEQQQHDSGYADSSAGAVRTSNAPSVPQAQRNSKSGKSGAMIYGIVMYNFQAERADELEAKAGEAIIVIAQSNPEWFVAKPIGRLGGPGLIPVSFIEIRDMATNTPVPNPEEAVKKAGIPRVEEWKKMAADYKNSSITLGKFEGGSGPQQGGQQGSLEQGMDRMSLQQQGAGRMSLQNGTFVRSSLSPFLGTLHLPPLVSSPTPFQPSSLRF